MKRIIGLAVFTLTAVFPVCASAQEGPDHMLVMQAQAGPPAEGNILIMHSQGGGAGDGNVVYKRGIAAQSGPATMITIGGTEFLFDGKQVKGAPFSADSVTETVQMLADGNRISNSSSTKIYRDTQGRTRRELGSEAQAMTVLPLPGPKLSHPEIMISDPVAGVNYMLDMESRTAQKLPLPSIQHVQKIMPAPGHAEAGNAASSNQPGRNTAPEHRLAIPALAVGSPDHTMVFRSSISGEVKTESLGTQTIEGVEAQGERVTTTIPAGQIGNELPIVSTNETWFSPRLQRVILSKRHDPRFGDTTFKLTNISLAEPSPSLFQVPSDFTITDPKMEAERLRKELERLKPELNRLKDLEGLKKEFQR